MRKPRLLVNVHLLLILGVVGYAIFSYSSIPEKYAAHFSLTGEVDRWAEKGGLEFWLVPAVAVGVGFLFLLALRFPRHFGYPQKEQVNRWPERRRIPVYEKLRELLMVVAVLVDLMLICLQIGIVNSAGGPMSISCLGVLCPTIALPVVFVIYLFKISRLVERIENELRLSGQF
jgi:uncharacterized membrane protein